tara:strand:+ start:475 stop:855 length:381 start_codon:yes stop_codon:yes gene_type:complete
MMNNPDNLFYTKEHEWVNLKENKAVIGITDYAQGQLGDVIFIEFPKVGQAVNAGDVFGEVEAVKTVSELYAPLSGTIIELNEELENSPDLVNNDPYGDGWIIKISPNKPDERDELMNFLSYEELIG